MALARPLASSARAAAPRRPARATALILRSRTKLLSFVGPLHTALAGTALVAVALATILSYAVARTVTRPLRAITAAMREMAATGDLTHGARVPPPGRWHGRGRAPAGQQLHRHDRGPGPLPARGGPPRAAHRPGPPLHRHRPRDPQPAHDHQDRHPHPAPGRAWPTASGARRCATSTARWAGSTTWWTTSSTSRAPSSSSSRRGRQRGLPGRGQRGHDAAIARLKVRLVLDPTLPRIVTDRERLRGALVNVLTNARHALEARDPGLTRPSGEPDLQVARSRRAASGS